MKKMLLVAALCCLALFVFATSALAANYTLALDELNPPEHALAVSDSDDTPRDQVTFTVPGSQPQMITIKLTANRPDLDFDFENFLMEAVPNRANPLELSYKAVFMPGRYTINIHNYGVIGSETRYTITGSTASFDSDEEEPNDDLSGTGIMTMATGRKYRGAIMQTEDGDFDIDIYEIVLAEDSEIDIQFGQLDQQLNYQLRTVETEEDDGELYWDWDGLFAAASALAVRLPGDQPQYVRERVALTAGTYYLAVDGELDSGDTNLSGRYELTMTVIGAPNQSMTLLYDKIVLPRDYPIPLSNPNPDELSLLVRTAYGFAPLPIKTPTSSKKGILEFDVDEDGSVWMTGTKTGTTTVTIKTLDNSQTFKLKVTIKNNEFTRKKPLSGPEKRVYTSTKKMYYDAKGNLVVQIYILNKTGSTIHVGADDLSLMICSSYFSDIVFYRRNVSWTPKKPLKNGKVRVVQFTIPEEELLEQWILIDGDYQAVLDYWYNAKSAKGGRIQSLRGKEKGVLEVAAPIDSIAKWQLAK